MVLSNGHFIITGKSIIDGMRFSECVEPLQYIRRNKGTGGRYWWNPFSLLHWKCVGNSSLPMDIPTWFQADQGLYHQMGRLDMLHVYIIEPAPDRTCGSTATSSRDSLLQELNSNIFPEPFWFRPALSAEASFLDKC